MRESLMDSGRHERGGVLIGTLVFVIVISVLLAGIGAFAVSHYSRAGTERDYMASLQLAEAAVNYELHRINSDITNPALADQINGTAGPMPIASLPDHAVAGTEGTFKAWVTNEPDDGTPWFAPRPLLVWGRGTVSGVSRTIRIRAGKVGVFDEYGLYGIGRDNNIGGTQTTIKGNYGTNGLTTNPGSARVYGAVSFNGVPDGDWPPGQTTLGVYHNPDPIQWPTVSMIADDAVRRKTNGLVTSGGLAWLATHNDNNLIQQFAPGDELLTDPATDLRMPAGLLQTGSWDLLRDFRGIPRDRTQMDDPPQGGGFPRPASAYARKRYVFPDTVYSYSNPARTVDVAQYGLYNNDVLILPGDPSGPRDYYFDHMTTNMSQAVLVDNRRGLVRIWLAGTNNQQDNISGTWIFTDQDPRKFRLYNAKATDLTVGGASVFPGGIYAYNGPGVGSIIFSGTPVVNGSVIAGSFRVTGNPTVNYPNNGAGNPDDYSLWYGFKDSWVEIGGR